MKKKVKRAVMIAAAAVTALILVYNIASAFVLSYEYEGDGGFFSRVSYSLSRLFTDPPSSTFKKTAYRLFGVTAEGSVFSGSDGYLFPLRDASFDYGADLSGRLRYDGEKLSAYLSSLETRRRALLLDNCELYVYVVPNSQTVLREQAGGDPSVRTAAEELEAYLHENGFMNFRLLRSELSHTGIPSYHNTENGINEYGAYLVYKEVAADMPDAVQRRYGKINLDASDISVIETDGRDLAIRAGIEKTAKNKTVVYPTAPYTSLYTAEPADGCTVCRLKDEYNDFIGSSRLLFLIPDADLREMLMPLFSASYTDTVYKNTLSYSDKTADLGHHAACVCILREDRLSELLDGADISTYEARTAEFERGGAVSAPRAVSSSYKKSGTVIIAGESFDAQTVTVASSLETVTVNSLDGRFIAELSAKPGERLALTGSREGRQTSETAYHTAPSSVSCEESVFAGGASMLYYEQTIADYTGGSAGASAAQLRKKLEKTVAKIRQLTGKDTKILFLAAPNPLTVYPGAASAELMQKRAETTNYDAVASALEGADGVEFLDIRGVMRQNSDIGKLYYQTDTHWTELGAYFGYRTLIEAVSRGFPAVAPLSLSSFTQTEKTVPAGDLSGFSGLSGLTENAVFLKPNFKLRAVGINEKPDTIDRSVYGDVLTSAVNDDRLPTAVMIRDSYSANLFPWICEHFSYLYCQSMWNYTPDHGKIEELKPDYVIYVICERNLGALT